MDIKILFRRFVALLLCCVLVGSSFARSAYATDPVTAASLAITGGQLAGAGLSGEAALSLAGPVGAVVGITLGALGVNAYVSQAAQEAGKTRTRFVLDKLVIWGAQAGYTKEQLYSKIAQGISVAADGTIQLSRDVCDKITQFANWLFQSDDLVVPSISTGGSNTVLGDLSLGVGQMSLYSSGPSSVYSCSISGTGYNGPYDRFWFSAYQSSYVNSFPTFYFLFVNSGASVLIFTERTISMNMGSGAYPSIVFGNVASVSSSSTGITASAGVLDGKYTYYSGSFPGSVGRVTSAGCSIYSGSVNQLLTDYSDQIIETIENPASDAVFVGSPDTWAANKDLLNPSADDTPVVLNPDLLNPIIDSLTDGQQATMSIIDYLQALQDAWDHALDDVQTAIGTITDSLTGIQEQIAIPQTAVENPTITNPSVTPNTTPILDPSAVDPGTAVTGLSFDLTQIFPFCIPFDIYAMLATLSATPEAPVYHVHYEGPYNILIDFTVDLSSWDSVAAVLRTVELLAFCIGLAYVTRSMFIRS